MIRVDKSDAAAIERPPFYACQMESRYMVILSGLKVNTRLQVIDTEKNAIPELYASAEKVETAI